MTLEESEGIRTVSLEVLGLGGDSLDEVEFAWRHTVPFEYRSILKARWITCGGVGGCRLSVVGYRYPVFGIRYRALLKAHGSELGAGGW
jgi:hypothetical protein